MNAKEWILPSKMILFFAFKNFDVPHLPLSLSANNNKNKNKTLRVPPCTFVSFWSCHLVNVKKQKQKKISDWALKFKELGQIYEMRAYLHFPIAKSN